MTTTVSLKAGSCNDSSKPTFAAPQPPARTALCSPAWASSACFDAERPGQEVHVGDVVTVGPRVDRVVELAVVVVHNTRPIPVRRAADDDQRGQVDQRRGNGSGLGCGNADDTRCDPDRRNAHRNPDAAFPTRLGHSDILPAWRSKRPLTGIVREVASPIGRFDEISPTTSATAPLRGRRRRRRGRFGPRCRCGRNGSSPVPRT